MNNFIYNFCRMILPDGLGLELNEEGKQIIRNSESGWENSDSVLDNLR